MDGDQKEESCEIGVRVQAVCPKRHRDERGPQLKGRDLHACMSEELSECKGVGGLSRLFVSE
jgi:transcription antitermination factor NusA-like protein